MTTYTTTLINLDIFVCVLKRDIYAGPASTEISMSDGANDLPIVTTLERKTLSDEAAPIVVMPRPRPRPRGRPRAFP